MMHPPLSSAPRRRFRWLRRLVVVIAMLIVTPYILAPFYRYGHPVSTLMLARWATLQPVSRAWRPLADISPNLVRAVIAAEDAHFCSHHGIDWSALGGVLADVAEGDATGGGSTITQQTVKNLFLWPGRSYLRKALELPLALWVDAVLPKARILEIYLNIAEWGPSGEFGAEAGARHAFATGAATLSTQQSALMAAVLPNPVRFSAARPGPLASRRAAVRARRAAVGSGLTACVSGS